jgi:hypothetical protein
MNQSVGISPRRRLVLAAIWAVFATVAVVEDASVAAQAGNSGGARSAPAIVGSEISWSADIEFESALLIVVGRSETKTVKQITFGPRDALRLDVSRHELADGRYKYELFLYPPSNLPATNARTTVRSGVFFVRGGLPMTPEDLDRQRPRTDDAPRRGGSN